MSVHPVIPVRRSFDEAEARARDVDGLGLDVRVPYRPRSPQRTPAPNSTAQPW